MITPTYFFTRKITSRATVVDSRYYWVQTIPSSCYLNSFTLSGTSICYKPHTLYITCHTPYTQPQTHTQRQRERELVNRAQKVDLSGNTADSYSRWWDQYPTWVGHDTQNTPKHCIFSRVVLKRHVSLPRPQRLKSQNTSAADKLK